MLQGKTKITKIGRSRYLLIPETIFNDSAFPIRDKEELNIEILDDHIIIN